MTLWDPILGSFLYNLLAKLLTGSNMYFNVAAEQYGTKRVVH